MRDQRSNVRELGGLRLQKLLASRSIKEEIANRDRSPSRQASFFDPKNLAASYFDNGAGILVRGARLQPQPANRRNRRKCLPAKAQRRNVQQVFRIFNLRSRVALKGQQSIVAHHPITVIGDLDELLAPGLNLNLDSHRTGIQRILEQLLHY